MWGRALLLVTVAALCRADTSTEDQDREPEDQQLKVGRAINVFGRIGYLSISMRVVPRNESDMSWLFREPTVDVFTGINHLIQRPKYLTRKPLLDGDFHMEFCDNLRQLLQAYFRDFKFEKLDRPWRAFTGSWVPELTARNLGINSSFVHGDHCYVLVRLSRYRQNVRMQPLQAPVGLEEDVAREVDGIQVGNVSSVVQFIRKFGSHYVSSYITGNSLYQVFVYERKVYTRIKERLKERGVQDLSSAELSNYFSPWYAQHMGRIRAASGNHTVEAWAERWLRAHYYIFTYPSLLKLHSEPPLLRTLTGLLRNEALLHIDLRTLAPAFTDVAKRMWFEEVIDNYQRLWDVNM